MQDINNEYGEVLDTKKVFWQMVNKHKKILFLYIFLALLIDVLFIKLLPEKFLSSEIGFWLMIFPWFFVIMWFYIAYSKIREAFWKQLALQYKWEYTFSRDISHEKALLFHAGNSMSAEHGVKGIYNEQPFQIFEYYYTIGSGRNKTTYEFTVFEIKFTGTFPHLYLNYKNDWYSNTPPIFSSLAKISVPKEFENKFKLYAPKEYEIETLEIFTPEIFALLIDSEWNHDMEFVDGELVIYRKIKFSNFADLDRELNKIKKFVDILAPLLNRSKLTQIGDISPSLRK